MQNKKRILSLICLFFISVLSVNVQAEGNGDSGPEINSEYRFMFSHSIKTAHEYIVAQIDTVITDFIKNPPTEIPVEELREQMKKEILDNTTVALYSCRSEVTENHYHLYNTHVPMEGILKKCAFIGKYNQRDFSATIDSINSNVRWKVTVPSYTSMFLPHLLMWILDGQSYVTSFGKLIEGMADTKNGGTLDSILSFIGSKMVDFSSILAHTVLTSLFSKLLGNYIFPTAIELIGGDIEPYAKVLPFQQAFTTSQKYFIPSYLNKKLKLDRIFLVPFRTAYFVEQIKIFLGEGDQTQKDSEGDE